MEAFLYDSTMHWKTKLGYKFQAKYIVICPGSALAGSCLVREWNITSMQINPPKAGYYPHSHNFQLVQNTSRVYSFSLPKDTGYAWITLIFTHKTWVQKKEPKKGKFVFLHHMLHLKMYIQKMCYSSTMPSRKQSHYRYQNENLHLLSHFGHVFFNSYQILSPNLGHQTKPPYTFFL